MPKTMTIEQHKREHVIQFDHKELELLIAKAAAQSLENHKPNVEGAGVTFKVTFDEVTEGSPSYRVGTMARVVIAEDMMPQVDERR